MLDPPVQSARWYDKYPNLKALVDVSQVLPRSVQDNIGENLISTIQRYQRALQSETELRSLGSEVVLGLYKSHKKQRWYDTIPAMHKAFNLMISLPENALLHLDDRCAGLVEYIRSHSLSTQANATSMMLKVHAFLQSREFIEIRNHSSHLTREPVRETPPPSTSS